MKSVKGFTLIELIISMGIVSGLIFTIFTVYENQKKKIIKQMDTMIQINDEVNNLRELLKDNKTCIEYFAINKIKYNPEKKHKSLSPKMKLRKIYPLKLVLNKDQSRTRKQKIVRVIRVKVILKDNLGALH